MEKVKKTFCITLLSEHWFSTNGEFVNLDCISIFIKSTSLLYTCNLCLFLFSDCFAAIKVFISFEVSRVNNIPTHSN